MAAAEQIPFEPLQNLNATTGKYATWIVRVLDPKVIDYTFNARKETVNASKFTCLLVSEDPAVYLPAIVHFEFNDRMAAKDAFQKFKVTPSFCASD